MVYILSYHEYMPKEKGYAHIALLTVLVLGILGLVASSNIQTSQKFSASPSQVLGEDETAQKTEEQQKENQQINIQSEGKKQETEIQTSNGQKIKTKVEDNGATKIEVEQGNFKLKSETEKGQTEPEVENELEEDEGIKISTESGKPTITRNKVTASTEFPLSVDATTHQITVNTPEGQKIVTILPDQAIQNMVGASPSAILNNLSAPIKLEFKDNEMVYKLRGEKKFRIFGLIPVSTSATAYVSAQSGNLVEQEQSLLTNLIKLISS